LLIKTKLYNINHYRLAKRSKSGAKAEQKRSKSGAKAEQKRSKKKKTKKTQNQE
jgi:hypothetical protein